MALQRALRRLLSGVAILPAFLMLYGDPVAAQWATTAGPSVRADFRPPARADDKGPVQSRRPGSGATPSASADRRAWLPEITGGRSGARKAVPVQRGQELGLRFRPEDHDTLYGQYPPAGVGGGTTDEAQRQFRPIAPRRKPTYEELEAQRRADALEPPPASMGYPILQPPMMPPATGPWPRW